VSLVSCCDKRAAANLGRCPASLRARRSQHVILRARRRRPTRQHASDTPPRRRAAPRRAHGRSRASRPAAGERHARPRAASLPPPRTVPPPLTGGSLVEFRPHSALGDQKAGRREGDCRGSHRRTGGADGRVADRGLPSRDLPNGNCRGLHCRFRWQVPSGSSEGQQGHKNVALLVFKSKRKTGRIGHMKVGARLDQIS